MIQTNEDGCVQSLATPDTENENTMEALPHFDFEKYDLCEFYYFRRPKLKPGFLPAQGGLVENAADLYPQAWTYLQSEDGRLLCKTESEWQAMTKAIWHTNANGTKVGWNGIGGAPFYAPDYATGALRLPDLRGMYAEGAGFDGLEVGAAHGDAARSITANLSSGHAYIFMGGSGSFQLSNPGTVVPQGIDVGGTLYSIASFNSAHVVPAANKNQPRAWGALPCVYLGAPK